MTSEWYHGAHLRILDMQHSTVLEIWRPPRHEIEDKVKTDAGGQDKWGTFATLHIHYYCKYPPLMACRPNKVVG